jgi:starch-binding outer membrane protein, SusD/RagB family
MKSKLIGTMILIGVIAFSACRKNLLDLVPKDKITDAEYWHTLNDLQLYCNSFYNGILPTYQGFDDGPYSVDANSDNMIAATYNSANNGERTVPASGGGWSWGALRNINYFLANYNKVAGADSAKNIFVGEALFFRSWFYFNMLKSFGDLPWINKPMQVTDTALIYSTRLKRNIIVDSMIQDLDRAISYLPGKKSAQAMRVNKEIAMAFESRIALYEGTWEKYHSGDPFGVPGSDGTKYLQKAADVAGALINENLYQLDNQGVPFGYWKLFNQTDYSGSKEVMFWRKYSVTDNPSFGNNWVRTLYLGGGVGLTKNLVDDYLTINGKPIAADPSYQGDDSLSLVVTNRDPRLRQTICVPDKDHPISVQPNGSTIYFTVPVFNGDPALICPTGYQLYKGSSPDYLQQQNISYIGYTGLILIRYAEVLLNYAEAKAELGTLQQTDVDMSINKLRSRVGMPNLDISNITVDPNWRFPNLSPIINEVRRERRVELAAEGMRKDDIFRWAAAGTLIKAWKPKGAKKNQWTTLVPANVLKNYPTDANGYIEFFQKVSGLVSGFQFNPNRDYLSPLPSNELVLNLNLQQNPGW